MSLRNSDTGLVALLPGWLRSDPVALGVAGAFEGEYLRLVEEIPLVRVWERLEDLGEPVLSLLAYEVNPLLWEADWTDAVKRRVLLGSLRWRMIHGTPACVEEFTAAVLGVGKVTVVPWWLYGGEPGRFRVMVEFGDLPHSDAAYELGLRAILAAKNTRSHLDVLGISVSTSGALRVGVASTMDEQITVKPYTPSIAMPAASGWPVAVVDILEVIVCKAEE